LCSNKKPFSELEGVFLRLSGRFAEHPSKAEVVFARTRSAAHVVMIAGNTSNLMTV
jgi:hypothetical protein